jgi:hypothetical protein
VYASEILSSICSKEIARDAGLVKAADGTGGSGQWQPNGNVSEEHLQAALIEERIDGLVNFLLVAGVRV